MDYKEIKNKSVKELHEILAEERNKLRELRFKASENQLKGVSEVSKIKKNIARILTAINMKRLAADEAREQTNPTDNK